MNISLDIKNHLTADVVVVGSGTAGVFAAIAAARGINVMDVEYTELCLKLEAIGAIVPKE